MGYCKHVLLSVLCLGFSANVLAQVTILDGLPGQYGIPYLSVGPIGNKVWENYRKGYDGNSPPYPLVRARSTENPERIHYTDLRQGCGPGGCAFNAPGLFIGSLPSLRSYDSTQFYLVSLGGGGAVESFDIRLGFVESLAAGGGNSFSQFVKNHGGDPGTMDLYFDHYGIDGIFLHLSASNAGATWTTSFSGGNLVAADSALTQSGRKTYLDSIQPPSLPSVLLPNALHPTYDTGIPSSLPLSMKWSLLQVAGTTTLNITLGNVATYAWRIDDGISLFGLTQPGNPDGVGYQNNSLDLPSLVPIMFLGAPGFASGDISTPTTMEIGVQAVYPVISVPSGLNQRGAPFNVSFLDLNGASPAQHAGTLHFSSDDVTSQLPLDFPFEVQSLAGHDFSINFNSGGYWKLNAVELESGIHAAPVTFGVPYRYKVGCAVTSGRTAPFEALAFLALFFMLRLGRKSFKQRHQVFTLED